MRVFQGRRSIAMAAFAFLCLVQPAMPQDPPSRVGMIAYLNGQAVFSPSESEKQYAPAVLNSTITTGNILVTHENSSLQVGIAATVIGLNANTQLQFCTLDDHTIQIGMDRGDIYVHIRGGAPEDVIEIGTPQMSVTLKAPGLYRIQEDADRDATAVAVSQGSAEVTGETGGIRSVAAPQRTEVMGRDSSKMMTVGEFAQDAFERDAEARDRVKIEPGRAPGPVIGLEALDEHGTIEKTSQYGPVWRPHGVPQGWAPYQDGQWSWVEPWGWTWVDEASWGFLPFHYGRWVHLPDGWAWVPPPPSAVYAPAMVAFVGDGSDGRAGDAPVAWVPLGPGEAYTPGFTASVNYWNQVNTTNTRLAPTTNIGAMYVQTQGGTRAGNLGARYMNQGVPGAVTTTSRESFAGGAPIKGSLSSMPMRQALTAHSLGGNPGVAPTPQSAFQSTAITDEPAEATPRQPFVLRRAPPPPPLAFSEKQQAIAANGGRPLDRASMQRLQRTAPSSASARGMSTAGNSGVSNRETPSVGTPDGRSHYVFSRGNQPGAAANGRAQTATPGPRAAQPQSVQPQSVQPQQRVGTAPARPAAQPAPAQRPVQRAIPPPPAPQPRPAAKPAPPPPPKPAPKPAPPQ